MTPTACEVRTGVRYWRHGVQQPACAVDGAGAEAVRPAAHRPRHRSRRNANGGDSPAWSPAPARLRAAAGARRGGSAPRPTPSCTATPTSASSTAPATPRSWPRRRPGSGSRRWPSPTTTASTAWCASPRRPGRSGCPPCSAPSCPSGSTEPAERRARPRGRPPARAGPRPGGLRPAGAGHQRRPAGRGARRASPIYDGVELGGGRTATTGWCSPAAARARCPRRWSSDGPAAAARELRPRWSTLFGRDNVAVELWDHGDPLDSAPQRRPRRARRPGRASTCVATNNVHYATPGPAAAGHRAGRGAGPAQPRRDRRLAARPAPAPTCARAPSRPAASPATPARSSGPPSSGRACAFDLRAGRARAAAVPVPRRPQRDELPAPRSPSEGADAALRAPRRRRAGARRLRARSTTSSTLIEQLGFPGYFLVVWDIVEFCRRADIYCQGRGSAANRAVCYALGITNADAVRARPAVRAVPVARARRPARHRHRHRVAAGGRRSIQYVYDRARPRPRRPGGQRHHLPRQVGGARHGQGARLRAGPAGRLVEAGRPPGAASARHRPAAGRRSTTIPAEVLDAGRRGRATSRATSASTPAAWCICDRPVDRGVPGRVGAHGGPHACCSGTRTTAPRSAW